MLAPLSSHWYFDLSLGEVALKLNFEIGAKDLTISSDRFDESALNSLNSFVKWDDKLVILDVVDDVMWAIVNHNENSTHVPHHVLPWFAYLHHFESILRAICVEEHGEIEHLIMSFLVIGRIP